MGRKWHTDHVHELQSADSDPQESPASTHEHTILTNEIIIITTEQEIAVFEFRRKHSFGHAPSDSQPTEREESNWRESDPRNLQQDQG